KLFSNATIALDVDTGKLKWYHQTAPDEGLDLDEVYEKILADNGPQKLLLTAGKKGITWKLDRTNGKFLDYVPMVFQNVFTSIDRKTGRGTYRADILHPEPGGSAPPFPAPSAGRDNTRRTPVCRHARPSGAAITGRPRVTFPKTI